MRRNDIEAQQQDPPPSKEDVHEDDDDDAGHKRTGTLSTASAHIITAVIGSGVLSLAWSVAQMGWLGGAVALTVFAVVTWYCSTLLADCYRSPDPVHGRRNTTYSQSVNAILGGFNYKLCGVAQYVNLVGTTVGYTITTAISVQAILKSNCYHKHGHDAECGGPTKMYIAIFGAVQLLMSQLPNFHNLWWLSYIASAMSFIYSSVGLGLSFYTIVKGGGDVVTSLTGVQVGVDVATMSAKTWNCLRALGDIAFAYTFTNVLVEIQDTLKPDPPENKVMKKACGMGVATTTVFYMACGLLGYGAFGNAAPGNFLTGFGFYEPFWLIDIANICVVIHLVGAYQVFAQPIFKLVESTCEAKWPDSKLLATKKAGCCSVSAFRIVWRSLYVVVATVVAMFFPFFNDFVGLVGALSYWPLTIYFPVEMHIRRNKLGSSSRTWWVLRTISLSCLLVSIAAVCGSVQGLVQKLTS